MAGLDGLVANEGGHGQVAHGQVAPLGHLLVRELGHLVVRSLEQLAQRDGRGLLLPEQLVGVVVVHGHAHADVLVVHLVVGRAVVAPGQLRLVGGGEGVDVQVGGKRVEDGARLASLQEEGHLAVSLVLVQVLQSILHLLRGDAVVAAADTALVTVVRVVDEEGIVFRGVEHLGVLKTRQSLDLLLVLADDGQHDLGLDHLALVVEVLLASSSMIPALAIRVGQGEQLARPGVLVVRERSLVRHVDNVVSGDARGDNILRMSRRG